MVTRMPADPRSGMAARRAFARASADGSVIGRSNAVATSRARPTTLRQSGRFAVISKSITASPPGSASTDATSNPRSPIVAAISSAEAEMSTNSRSQERTSRIVNVEPEPRRPRRRHEDQENRFSVEVQIFVFFVFLRELRGSGEMPLVRKLFQKPHVVLVEQPDVFHLVAENRHALDADAPGKAGVLLGIVADRL